ncbi:MAG: hypothetical protein ACOCVM_08585 [Desulfovibrionaceae bacterium]
MKANVIVQTVVSGVAFFLVMLHHGAASCEEYRVTVNGIEFSCTTKILRNEPIYNNWEAIRVKYTDVSNGVAIQFTCSKSYPGAPYCNKYACTISNSGKDLKRVLLEYNFYSISGTRLLIDWGMQGAHKWVCKDLLPKTGISKRREYR